MNTGLDTFTPRVSGLLEKGGERVEETGEGACVPGPAISKLLDRSRPRSRHFVTLPDKRETRAALGNSPEGGTEIRAGYIGIHQQGLR